MSGTQLTELHVGRAAMIGCVAAALHVETDVIDVTAAAGHTVPDARWTYIDRAGHWHAAATRTAAIETQVWYPTLQEHVEPNPAYDPQLVDWGEYDEPRELRWLVCAICGQRVDPRTSTSHERRYIAGRLHWWIMVEVADDRWWGNGLPGSLFTVRGIARLAPSSQHPTPRSREWFGVARWHPSGMLTAGDDPPIVTGTFEGVSELGERVG